METVELHRGRLIDHLQLVVSDLERSKLFYRAIFEALDVPIGEEGAGFFWADELFVSDASSPAAAGKLTGRTHFAFQARDREAVDRAHQEGIAAGGVDNGEPGVRPYHPGYYAGYLLDPDGNNIEIVHHGPATRSADSVHITFSA